MYCPSCENLMDDKSKYCGKCGMFLNKKSILLVHLSINFSWIWRRSWAGFAAGFIGWVVALGISRMIGQNIAPHLNSLFSGLICGVFLGSVGGIIEESGYKAFLGGILGAVGGAIGGFLNLFLVQGLSGHDYAFPLSFLISWGVGGAFIGAASGIIEKSPKKSFAGILFGAAGGCMGGFLGSLFYASILADFQPQAWLPNRILEGTSGGFVGAILWFCIGLVEKLYIFRRREDPTLTEKTCDNCNERNPLNFWYCTKCGHTLKLAAPRQKIVVTQFRGLERAVNALKFLSWLFGVTGVIITPVIFLIFLLQDVFFALLSVFITVLFCYLMVVLFKFLADLLECLIKLSIKST